MLGVCSVVPKYKVKHWFYPQRVCFPFLCQPLWFDNCLQSSKITQGNLGLWIPVFFIKMWLCLLTICIMFFFSSPIEASLKGKCADVCVHSQRAQRREYSCGKRCSDVLHIDELSWNTTPVFKTVGNRACIAFISFCENISWKVRQFSAALFKRGTWRQQALLEICLRWHWGQVENKCLRSYSPWAG